MRSARSKISLLYLCAVLTTFSMMALAAENALLPDLKTAKELYRNKQYEQAAAHWRPLAEQGFIEAQLNLGKLYANGQGVEKNPSKAFDLFIAAAEKEDIRALFEIGRAYERGNGIAQDYEKAKKFYLLATKNGYARGSYEVGRLYQRGDINADDYLDSDTAALHYYQQAAENGYARGAERIAEIKGHDYIQQNNSATKKKYRIKSDVKTQLVAEDNLDLGTRNNDTESAFIVNGKVSSSYQATDNLSGYAEMRGLYSAGIAQSNITNDEDTSNTSFVEMRQLWAKYKNLFGYKPLSLKAGRQRFYEPSGIWWNRDLDAARVSFDTTLTNGFIAAGENQSKYRVGKDNDLERDEEKRTRIFGKIEHQYKKNHSLNLKFLFENDRSGTKAIGQNINANDRDDEDFKGLWAGIESKGTFHTKNGIFKTLRYRTSITSLIGKETLTATTAGPSADLRTVSALSDRDVTGWAFDSGIEVTPDLYGTPTFLMNYSYASGDDGNGGNSAFHQTGLQGNTSIRPEYDSTAASRNYGEVLRPELSNIHVAHVGMNFPIFAASDMNLNYFSYWLANKNTGLRSSGISAPLNGQDNHLGQAIDVNANINIGQELDSENKLLENLALRLRLGSFRAGKAYGFQEGEYAYRGTAEVRVKF